MKNVFVGQDISWTQNQIMADVFFTDQLNWAELWLSCSQLSARQIPRFHEKKSLVSSRIFKLEAVALHALFEDSLMELAPAMDPN